MGKPWAVFLCRKRRRNERKRKMRKKETRLYNKMKIRRFAGRCAAVAAAVCLLAGTVLTVYGEERNETDGGLGKKVVATNIYHRHLGNPDVSGGCYRLEIEHKHKGDEQNGGECFRTEVFHVHQGDAVSGGGCYGKGIPHVHRDECYESHTHNDGCFQTIKCDEIYTQVTPYGTTEEECQSHGTTTFVLADSVVVHSVCGREPSNVTVKYCQTCNQYQNTWHSEKQKLCPYDEGDIDYDSLICGKEGNDAVDGYEKDCGFDDGAVESYEKSCDKTVDGYGLSCGLAEDTPVGRLILTSETAKEGEKAQITARMEDLSFGSLIPDSNPFTWRDDEGNVIGNGSLVEVAENGNYSVTLNLVNKDVDESGLCSSILVDSIKKEELKPTPQPEKTPDPSGGNAGKDDGKDDNKDSGENDGKDDGDKDEGGDGDGNEDNGGGDEDDGSGGSGGDDGNTAVKQKQNETPEEIPSGKNPDGGNSTFAGSLKGENAGQSPSPSIGPKKQLRVKKETVSVEARENEAAQEDSVQVQQEKKKNSIFDFPAVRVITITTGSLLLLACILFLLAYLRRSVKIYNDDGEGKLHYLGRCLIHREEDVYFLAISDEMVEKSYTNRYCIKPGLFRIGKDEDEELVVYKETKKAVVPLSREMTVTL